MHLDPLKYIIAFDLCLLLAPYIIEVNIRGSYDVFYREHNDGRHSPEIEM